MSAYLRLLRGNRDFRLQREVPDHIRGRVFSADYGFVVASVCIVFAIWRLVERWRLAGCRRGRPARAVGGQARRLPLQPPGRRRSMTLRRRRSFSVTA